MINLKVKDAMSSNIKTVTLLSNMVAVEKMMDEFNIHHVPVVNDQNELEGIISRNDIERLKHWATKYELPVALDQNKDILRSMLAHDVMKKNVVTVDPDKNLGYCANIFKENLFHCLPVISNKQIIGMITPFDLINVAYTSHSIKQAL